MFYEKKYNRLSIYHAPKLDQQSELVHGFSSKHGGYSKAPFSGLNLGLATGDDISLVQENRRAFTQALGIDPAQVVCGKQVHGTNIVRVTAQDGGKGFCEEATAFQNTDGLITDQRGIALMTFYADCVPVLFYDAYQHVIGVCHCGWRGTVNRMAAKTATAMMDAYGCRAEHLYVAIGPSISQAQYEVDRTVLEQFEKAFSFSSSIILSTDENHGKIDLWKANQLQLEEIGLLPEHIEVSGLCTYQNVDTFYSHRAEQGKAGRNGAIIMMKK